MLRTLPLAAALACALATSACTTTGTGSLTAAAVSADLAKGLALAKDACGVEAGLARAGIIAAAAGPIATAEEIATVACDLVEVAP